MIEDSLKLKDGRWLGYGMYGNPKGIPILDFHGIPGSRREAALIAEYLGRDDLCLVGFDRPGYGRSSPQRSFRVASFTEDVISLVDHLGIQRFIAFGYSGGGLFALAAARNIPERITALGIVSGIGPPQVGSEGMHEANRKKFNLAQKWPAVTKLLLTVAFSSLRRHPEKLSSQLEKIWQQMPEPDRLALQSRPITHSRQALQESQILLGRQDTLDRSVSQKRPFSDGILAVTLDAISGGVSGWVNEEVLVAQPWQFDLSDIHCPNVFLWHGCLDRNVPVAMGKAVADRITGCQAEFIEGEGHLSLLYNHGREIMDRLVQAGSSRE